jgi:threonine synthase
MGLPIEQLTIATNDNDILARARATGAYEVSGVKATSSPSMDIQVSSNFERYLFEASGRDATWVRAKMGALAQSGSFELGPALEPMRRDFAATSASEAEVADCIRLRQQRSGYLLDPHSACGVVAAEKAGPGGRAAHRARHAHPAKVPRRPAGDHRRAAGAAAAGLPP